MNGTDLPTLNIYGSSGQLPRESVGVYTYPRDIEILKARVSDVRESTLEITTDLTAQGLNLPAHAAPVSIFAHRYVVCTSDLNRRVVLSIVVNSTDAIVYAHSLEAYLQRDFLEGWGKPKSD